MPVAGSGPGGNRQTFRPPWVKEGPPPIPMPSQPWVKSNRPAGPPPDTKEAAGVVTKALRKASDAGKEGGPSTTPERKRSSITIIPTVTKENGEEPPKKPQASRKTSEPAPKPSTEATRKISEPASKPPAEPSKKTVEPPKKTAEPKKTEAPKKVEPPKAPPIQRNESRPRVLERSATSDKYEGLAVAPKPPAPPPAPPMPPPPPPLPTTKDMLPDKVPISEHQKAKLEALRSRPKRRPDWGNMMKEIETGRKLCHVQCNDRSSPLLPMVKAKGQFVYESERPNLHNQLLKQIASGVKLKPVKTNDRSRPFIEGLRKFRRQMTIEEQIQKSTSIASMGIAEVEPDPLDEVDDIDKVRDDLQSTKQLLAMELKNKEAMERENKKLIARILNLEVELEKEKNRLSKGASVDEIENKKEMDKLRTDAEQAKKTAEEMETKFHDTAAQLELTKLELDETVAKAQRLEKQLKVAQAANLANASSPLAKQPSSKKIANQKVADVPANRRDIDDEESEDEDEEEETETETEPESDGEQDAAAAAEKRQARELKMLASKLKSLKDKRQNAKKERKALKEQTLKQQKALKDEKKKYKLLQKEVDKMSKLMNEDDDDEEDEEAEEEEESDQSESEESESESDSEESDGDLPESAPAEKRKTNYQNRVKRYENLVSSLKKGNYLLKANVERYRDELNKQKEMSISLQEDLNSVLAELG